MDCTVSSSSCTCCGWPAAVAKTGVAALEVVVAQVSTKIATQCGELWHQRAGEGGSPAFFEHGALHPFDRAIGLRSAGPNEAMLGTPAIHRLTERRGAKLRAVVRRDGPELPTGRRQVTCHPVDQGGSEAHGRIERRDVDLAPDE